MPLSVHATLMFTNNNLDAVGEFAGRLSIGVHRESFPYRFSESDDDTQLVACLVGQNILVTGNNGARFDVVGCLCNELREDNNFVIVQP